MELKPIRSIDKRNMKITFYLSEGLYTEYKAIQKKAKAMGYKVDLSADFSSWFAKQLENAKISISNLGKKKSAE